jgi:hypothetical protein
MNLSAPGAYAGALMERLKQLGLRTDALRHEPADRTQADAADRTQADAAVPGAPLPPSADELATLLDSCFFATLMTEEGRPTRFSCAFLDPAELDGISARRLARPLPVTPDVIRRIAPAVDPQLTCLGVRGSNDGLQIWGLIDAPRLRAFQVFGSDTGFLRVAYLHQTQMTYGNGVGWVRGERDPSFVTSIRLIAAAMGLVKPQWYRPRALLGLADELIRAGHGGAILVSRRPRDDIRSGRISLTYPSDGPLTTLEEPVLEAQEADPAGSPDDGLFQHFRSAQRQNDIRRTARLGAVDGAVLVDPHLRIIGFGAMIDVEGMRNGGRAFEVDLAGAIDHLSEAPADLSRVSARREVPVEGAGGQRHQSALRWCSTSPAAQLALVCSQDGEASMVAPIGPDGDVGLVRNIETSPDNW